MPTTDYSYADSPELRARKERIAMAKTRVGDQQFAATDMQRSLGMNDRLAYDVNISAQAGAEQMVPERNTPDDILRYLEAYDKLREEMTAEVSKQVVSDPEYFAQRYGQQPTQEMQAASDGVPAGTAEEIAARSDFGAPTTTGIGPQEVPTEFEKIKPADELGSQPSQQVPEQAGLEAGLPPQDPNNPVANRVRGVEFSGVRVIPGAQDTPDGMVFYNGQQMPIDQAYQIFLDEERQAGRSAPEVPTEAMGAPMEASASNDPQEGYGQDRYDAVSGNRFGNREIGKFKKRKTEGNDTALMGGENVKRTASRPKNFRKQ